MFFSDDLHKVGDTIYGLFSSPQRYDFSVNVENKFFPQGQIIYLEYPIGVGLSSLNWSTMYLWRQHKAQEADNPLTMLINDQWDKFIYLIAMRRIRRCVIAWLQLWTHCTQSILISKNFSTGDKNIAIIISKIKELRFRLAFQQQSPT